MREEVYGRRPGKNRWFALFVVLLGAAVLFLTFSILGGLSGEKQEYQFVVSLGGLKYDEDFLEKAAEIEGICRISPVLELPVRLRIGDYTMDTVVQALDIDALDKEVRSARGTPLGNTPVLLLGKDSLGEMRDYNDHVISGEQQKRFLADFADLEAYLCLNAESGEEQWKSCIVAGVLDTPASGIYLPFDQGEALLGGAGRAEIEKALLTVKGKTNYEKALEMFTS